LPGEVDDVGGEIEGHVPKIATLEA
jgi:hypothetical protein